MRDYRRVCISCRQIFDYRTAVDPESCICSVCGYDEDDEDDFDADELGLDPEEPYDYA